jgi:hypothetical protein
MNASLKSSPSPTDPIPSLEALRTRLKRLNLFGLLAQAEEIRHEPWLLRVLEIEEGERQTRSLKRRFGNAAAGPAGASWMRWRITRASSKDWVDASGTTLIDTLHGSQITLRCPVCAMADTGV